MTARLATAVRTAALLLPAVTVAGAAPAPRHLYTFRCRLVRTDGTELGSPTVSAFERQPCSLTAGGSVPTCRPGVSLDYGMTLAAWAAPAADGRVLLDLTLSTTALDDDDSADAVTVAGTTVHTVRTVRSGQPAHVSVGPALTLDLTVDDVAR